MKKIFFVSLLFAAAIIQADTDYDNAKTILGLPATQLMRLFLW